MNFAVAIDLAKSVFELAAADETIEYEFAAAPAPIPEPGTMLLLGSGLSAAVLRWRRRA